MANKIFINPLTMGADDKTPSVLLGEGVVRQAHNMEVVKNGGGLQRIKGWGDPSTANGTFPATYYGVMQLGGHLARLYAPSSGVCSMDVLTLQASNDPVIGDLGRWGDEEWHSMSYYSNDTSTYTTTTVEDPPHFTGRYTFSNHRTLGTYNDEGTQTWGVSHEGDIFLGLDKLRVQRNGDTVDWPTGLPARLDNWAIQAVECADQRMWIGLKDGTILFSNIGDPWDWDSLIGTAGEVYLDGEVTNLVALPDGTLFASTPNSIYVLYNTDSITDGPLEVKRISPNVGAFMGTAKRLDDDVIFMNIEGVTTLSLTQEYGNFKTASSSDKMYYLGLDIPLTQKDAGRYWCEVLQHKKQYVIFSSGWTWDSNIITPPKGYLVTVQSTTDLKTWGWSTFDWPSTIGAINSPSLTRTSIEMTEYLYFIGDNGTDWTVYKAFDGMDANGSPYVSWFTTGYMNFGGPYIEKTFKKIILEVYDEDDTNISYDIHASYDGGLETYPSDSTSEDAVKKKIWSSENGATHQLSYDETQWKNVQSYMGGIGDSISITVSKDAHTTNHPYIVKSLAVVYENRGVTH